MIDKMRSVLKLWIYKIKYKKAFQVDGFPKFDSLAKIKISNGGRIKVGRIFVMKQCAYIAAVNGGQVEIGHHVSINRNTIMVCHDRISIGDGCAIGPNVIFYDHDHRFDEHGVQPGYKTAPISVGKDCWIGAGVVVLRGTKVGDGCIIGAGSILKGEIPDHSLVTSNREFAIVPIVER